MLQSNGLKGRISAKESITAKLNNKEVQVYPELEDLTVTPSVEEQHFKSNKYGYDNVTVKAVESKEIAIVPSVEEQVKEGIFNKVTVAGDSNLVPENIKEGAEIFGVQGVAKTTDVKITDGYYLFYNNHRIDQVDNILKLCDNMTDASYMFYDCSSLTSLDLSNFDTSNVTNMGHMFRDCSTIKNINLSGFDTSKVTDMSYMFYGCTRLRTLDLSNFDASNVVSITSMFTNVANLQNFTSFKNLGKGYTQESNNYSSYKLSITSTYITYDSLMSVINNLYDLNLTYDVENGGTLYAQSLTLGSTNLAKLTAEEIAIATNKGWNVS